MVLSGKGSQFWITKSYQEDRVKALEDRSKYTDTQLDLVDVLDDEALGGGKTDENSYIIRQFPYPVDASIRRKEKVDLRIVDKTTGGNI